RQPTPPVRSRRSPPLGCLMTRPPRSSVSTWPKSSNLSRPAPSRADPRPKENTVESAVIIDAVRTGTGKGKAGGGLSGVHAVELLRQTLQGLVGLTGIDPGGVEDVMIGCVSQGGEQAACPGRIAWLGAGYPPHVPSTTIDRRCGSSQQAVHFAAQSIMSGWHDVVVAGGVESMSRVPMGSARGDADVFGPSV